MKYIQIFIVILFSVNSALVPMQNNNPASAATSSNQALILSHKKRAEHELVHEIPSSLQSKPLIQLTALMEQEDTFSCGVRTLFHMRCLTMALENATQGTKLEESLKVMLQDREILDLTFDHVKQYLDQYDPTHNRNLGLCINHLLGVCALKIPSLDTNLLPIELGDNKKIYAIHDPTPNRPSPLHYSQRFTRQYATAAFPMDICKVELDQSVELRYHLKKIEKRLQVAHFICRYPRHYFLASIVTDEWKNATLYVIDSNNNNLANHESIRMLTTKLLTYVESHNEQRKNKKQKK
jgi:hypothetical protein